MSRTVRQNGRFPAALAAGWTLSWLVASCGGGEPTGPAHQQPTTVAFVTEPTTPAAGVTFLSPPTVEIRDAAGQRVASASSAVSLSLIDGPPGATLAGALTAQAIQGLATFPGLSVGKAATAYRLVATSPGLVPDTSGSFQVQAGPVDHLHFSTEPGMASGGLPFGIQPVVTIEDAQGNPASVSLQVMVQLGANPPGGTLSGTGTIPSTNGVATFVGLSLDKASSGYVLTASAAGLAPASSVPFTVAVGPPSPTTSTLSSDYSLLAVGDSVAVTLVTRDRGGNLLTSGGAGVEFTNTPGGGTTMDLGDGTYTFRTASSGGGVASVGALLNGVLVLTPQVVITTLAFTEVSAGGDHSCALASTGDLYCWGGGASGQLGTGTRADTTVPVLVTGGPVWAGVAAGGGYTCAVTMAQEARCWGRNAFGVLGIGQPDTGPGSDALAPVTVTGGQVFTKVRTSLAGTACGLTSTYYVYCWGRNDHGQVGDSTMTDRTVPTQLVPQSGGIQFSDVDPGENHTCGVTEFSQVANGFCWGSDSAGALGDGPGPLAWTCAGSPCSLEPVAVMGLGTAFFASTTAHSISLGSDHGCAMEATGKSYCWGGNASGQLGDGGTTPSDVAEALAGIDFLRLTSGSRFTCGIAGGSVYCWGANDAGQLGIGTQISQPLPTATGVSAVDVDAGANHACMIGPNGVVYCWGENSSGQLGDGTRAMRLAPTRVEIRR